MVTNGRAEAIQTCEVQQSVVVLIEDMRVLQSRVKIDRAACGEAKDIAVTHFLKIHGNTEVFCC
jgi:hypothetical protein